MNKPRSTTTIIFILGSILIIAVLLGFMVMAPGRGEEDSPAATVPEATQPATPEQASTEISQPTTEADMTFQLTSDAFANGQSIPAKYSCVGKNISPALTWTEPPAGTGSFALIVDDPDAPMGTWVHWVLYNIPAETRSLAEGFSPVDSIAVGRNSSSQTSYQGPCPPSGTHRYYFKLYALDSILSLSPGAKKEELLKAMQGHILAQSELMGTFSK